MYFRPSCNNVLRSAYAVNFRKHIMARKQFFLIIDTETTQKDTVADFAAVVVDRLGTIHAQCAVLVNGHYGTHELFHHVAEDGSIWGKKGLELRKQNYVNMLNNGTRMIASIGAINKWLAKAADTYKPVLTGYNLPFDLNKCANTKIDLPFDDSFCLWQLSVGNLVNTKEYRNFVLQNHLFNTPTELGNMTFQTNAEVMASYLNGSMLPPEPHTALEDIIGYEIPILKAIVRKKKFREKAVPYNWRECQVKNHFTAL
jgi:hypothetical protein